MKATAPPTDAAAAPDRRPTIVWFRRDLRLTDQLAWNAALRRGAPVVPVFIWSPDEEAPWAPGAASRWWLHHALAALMADLERAGLRLVIRTGPTLAALQALARETGAGAVYWSRLYEPAILARDKAVKAALRAEGLEARSFNAALLHEPWAILTQQERPYQVFTPYHRACQTLGEPSRPETVSETPLSLANSPASRSLASLGLLPGKPWDTGFHVVWQPGSAGAWKRLESFAGDRAPLYAGDRDRPDLEATSRLSPHLHFGEISPREVWWRLRAARHGAAAEPYLRQLIWREFAHHLLFHFPQTPSEPLRAEFNTFPWSRDAAAFRAWRKGRTGFPIVDAGLRELWTTGWMHNRVRMIVASFLVKDLLIPWQDGARWFWDTLVDADLANNTLGWQWAAGCGADAAPYFRVFNPALQAAKFDPAGAYVRRWIPAGESAYPAPMVDHAEARDRALAAYQAMRAGSARGKP